MVLRPALNLSTSLPVTLSGLHGRSARPPSPSSSTARLRARGTLHATGSGEAAPAPRRDHSLSSLIIAPSVSLRFQPQFNLQFASSHWLRILSPDRASSHVFGPPISLNHEVRPDPRQLSIHVAHPLPSRPRSTLSPAAPNPPKTLSAQPRAAPLPSTPR